MTVLGSTAQIEKELRSAEIARVGESVTFRVRLTVSGDTPVSDVAVIDTFESQYLEFSSASGDCALVEGHPDPSHSSVICYIGDVSPASGATPGTQVFEYELTFTAVGSTLPGTTINEAIASLDLDGAGPGAPAEIGPATAAVEVIEVLGLQLPPTGDGSTSTPSGGPAPALALGAMALGVLAALGVRRHRQR